jgi:hypothetical protein
MFPSSNQIASHGFGGQQQHVQQIFQNSPIQGIHMPTPQSMQPVHQQGQIFQNQAQIPDQIPQLTNQQQFGNQQQFANQNI